MFNLVININYSYPAYKMIYNITGRYTVYLHS